MTILTTRGYPYPIGSEANNIPGNLATLAAAIDADVAGVAARIPGTRVRVATTGNGTLATAYANGQTVDGVVLATNDYILLKNQTTGTENGVYKVNAAGAPTRDTFFDTTVEFLPQTLVAVSEGTSNADSIWQLTTNATITLGATALTFYPVHLQGTGSPEGVVTAPIGATYKRLDGTNGTTKYEKESGTGNTGWRAPGKVLGVGLHKSGTMNIPAGGGTVLTWEVEDYDDDTMHAANSGIIVLPYIGKYRFSYTIDWTNGATVTFGPVSLYPQLGGVSFSTGLSLVSTAELLANGRHCRVGGGTFHNPTAAQNFTMVADNFAGNSTLVVAADTNIQVEYLGQ